MGEKDLSQKSLEYYPDVFADCVNALLYEGKQVLRKEGLLPAPTETIYPDTEGRLRSQLQDVSKFETEGGSVRAQYTIENQTRTEKGMVLRKAGYEGAIYRRQYMERNISIKRSKYTRENKAAKGSTSAEENSSTKRNAYPVISMVLYWGRSQWNSPRSLRRLTKGRLPKEAMKYVDDIRLHVYEMARLPEEVRRRFRSDMRIAVDYLAEGSNYVPTGQKILHTEALLRLLRELTRDERYEKILKSTMEKEKKEGTTMCELLDKYWNGGVAEGEARGRTEGKAESVGIIRSMYAHMLTSEAIAELTSQRRDYVDSIIVLCVRYPLEDDVAIAKRLLAGETPQSP